MTSASRASLGNSSATKRVAVVVVVDRAAVDSGTGPCEGSAGIEMTDAVIGLRCGDGWNAPSRRKIRPGSQRPQARYRSLSSSIASA